MYMNGFVWLWSDDEVNQYLAPGIGAAFELNVLARFPEEGLPDGGRGLVVDLDSLAPGPSALQRLVKELSGRLYSYPVAAFGYSLEDHQIMDLRDAGIHVFPHCLCPAVFAAIADQSSEGPSAGGTPAPPIQPYREPETCGMCPWGRDPAIPVSG